MRCRSAISCCSRCACCSSLAVRSATRCSSSVLARSRAASLWVRSRRSAACRAKHVEQAQIAFRGLVRPGASALRACPAGGQSVRQRGVDCSGTNVGATVDVEVGGANKEFTGLNVGDDYALSGARGLRRRRSLNPGPHIPRRRRTPGEIPSRSGAAGRCAPHRTYVCSPFQSALG